MSVSKIQVDSVKGYDPENSAVIFSQGVTVPSGKIISGAGNMNIVGVLTATTFIGNANGITNVAFATTGKSIGLIYIGG